MKRLVYTTYLLLLVPILGLLKQQEIVYACEHQFSYPDETYIEFVIESRINSPYFTVYRPQTVVFCNTHHFIQFRHISYFSAGARRLTFLIPAHLDVDVPLPRIRILTICHKKSIGNHSSENEFYKNSVC